MCVCVCVYVYTYIYRYMCVSPPRQVDRAHLRAAELECQLAALAAQVSKPPFYKYTGALQTGLLNTQTGPVVKHHYSTL